MKMELWSCKLENNEHFMFTDLLEMVGTLGVELDTKFRNEMTKHLEILCEEFS